ncbi:DUF58 domain-containing protein [Halioxenophilus sp. WMMB6]|uniref:DUF58 domain-containing protein n=1 Tax=Halioxenophilus sp. WMMB6 TaxID=3073815 RepID=UPI00295F49BE|nr:DUF58 domain-containing protein [Halioxenophilus sp. WMMB6]
MGLGILLTIAALIDAFRPGPLNQKLSIERELPGSLGLGVNCKARAVLHNQLPRELTLILAEAPSDKLNIKQLPVKLRLKPNQKSEVLYSVIPTDRGVETLQEFIVRVDSPWLLWQHKIRIGNHSTVKIYPNFSPIAHIAALGVEQHVRQLGIHLSQRRGEGMEFKQLREFIEGDALRQIDWKTTARQRKPISREYQDERNQEIFFLLDCGRRLRHKDGELSHFDHALNAILLTAYIAIRQGDSAGFASFAGQERWLSPVKGSMGVNRLLNLLFDLQSTLENSDFLQVAEKFQARHRRRSLVIIVSNIREEDSEDLIKATRLLSKSHVVMVASLREHLLDETLNRPATNFSDSLAYAATHQFMAERQQVLHKLVNAGVVVVDSLPEQLHIRLVNEYFRLKRSHRL